MQNNIAVEDMPSSLSILESKQIHVASVVRVFLIQK